MLTFNLYNLEANVIDNIEIDDKLFNKSNVSDYSVYEAVKAYLANQRSGTACTKTRGEVSGSGRKPWRQKGTGRARVGSIRTPIWRKGGIVFGPKPHSYYINLPKKVKKKALLSAIIARLEDNNIIFLNELHLDKISTKEANKILLNFKNKGLLHDKKLLIVLDKKDKTVELSFRNIKGVEITLPENLNAYQVLYYPELLVVKEAFFRLTERLKK